MTGSFTISFSKCFVIILQHFEITTIFVVQKPESLLRSHAYAETFKDTQIII